MEYKVYIKTNALGHIVEINSSAFLEDLTGWTEIACGDGDKYHHPQDYFLPLGFTDENGIANYKYSGGEIVPRTAADKADELANLAVTREIGELKAALAATDYIAAKIAEGAATREEYADKIAQRAIWRARINELEQL